MWTTSSIKWWPSVVRQLIQHTRTQVDVKVYITAWLKQTDTQTDKRSTHSLASLLLSSNLIERKWLTIWRYCSIWLACRYFVLFFRSYWKYCIYSASICKDWHSDILSMHSVRSFVRQSVRGVIWTLNNLWHSLLRKVIPDQIFCGVVRSSPIRSHTTSWIII